MPPGSESVNGCDEGLRESTEDNKAVLQVMKGKMGLWPRATEEEERSDAAGQAGGGGGGATKGMDLSSLGHPRASSQGFDSGAGI